MRRLVLLSTLAALALPAAGTQATTGRLVDLGSGRVNGDRILGLTVPQVTAALGRPDFRVGPLSRYRIGYGTQSNFSTEVIFRRHGGIQRAWSIVFERGAVRDVKVGDLLQRSPALQKAILDKYGSTFRLTRSYDCKRNPCIGEFAARDGALHLTFGTQPVTGTWLTIWTVTG
jgi:hypothetical protein